MAAQPTRRASSSLWLPERSREKHTLDHFERFCYSLKLPKGLGPFVLFDHELALFEDYFNGVRRNLWLLPTGQRKSMLLGAIGLHFATYVCEDARVFILGGMATHARHALRAATGFVNRSPDLRTIWVPQEYRSGRLKCLIPHDTAVIEVYSAGNRVGEKAGESVEGEEPDLILVEELHRHEDGGGAVDTMWSKAQKTHAQMAIVTTAGANLDSVLGNYVKEASDVNAGAIITRNRPNEHYRRCITRNGKLVMHEWAVPDNIVPPTLPDGKKKTADQYEAELDAYIIEVKKAHPAPFRTLEDLRDTFDGMAKRPWRFQRQACNQWVTQARTALDRVGWMLGGPNLEFGRDPAEIPNGTEGVVIGLDLSDSWDTTAIVPVFRRQEEILDDRGIVRVQWVYYTAKAEIIPGTGTERAIRKREVFNRLAILNEAWPGAVLAFDPAFGGKTVAEELEEQYGMRTVAIGSKKPFTMASMALAELIAESRVKHDGNETMTSHVLAASRRDTKFGDDWALCQSPDKRPIDGAVGLANGVWGLIALGEEDEGLVLTAEDFEDWGN